MGQQSSQVEEESSDQKHQKSRGVLSGILGTTWRHSNRILQHDDLIVQIMMPLYYNPDELTSDDVHAAKRSWDLILSDAAINYQDKKSELTFHSCREWFEHLFYDRLFDVHPFSKKMFRNLETQGKFLVALFSFIFTVLENKEKFHDKLVELAISHCKRGIKACEYAIIGDVMFWTLKTILGSEYDLASHNGWMKLFSNMLQIIVPISITYELKSNEAQAKRFQNYYRVQSKENVGLDTSDETSVSLTCPFAGSETQTPSSGTSIAIINPKADLAPIIEESTA